jgi:hypothetical protein
MRIRNANNLAILLLLTIVNACTLQAQRKRPSALLRAVRVAPVPASLTIRQVPGLSWAHTQSSRSIYDPKPEN